MTTETELAKLEARLIKRHVLASDDATFTQRCRDRAWRAGPASAVQATPAPPASTTSTSGSARPPPTAPLAGDPKEAVRAMSEAEFNQAVRERRWNQGNR